MVDAFYGEYWIVTDEYGEVLGRLRSPYFSSACHFAELWWPDSQPAVWRWQDAQASQQAQAAELPLLDTQKHNYLLDWAKRLQEKFERTTGRVQ